MLNYLTLNYIIELFSWQKAGHPDTAFSVEHSKTSHYSVEVKTLPTYVIVLVSVFFIMKIVSHFQKGAVNFYYHRESNLMSRFMLETDVSEQVYAPYWFTTSGVLQAIMSVVAEIFLKFAYPIRYERELFKLSDGGTIAIDWAVDSEGGLP